MAKNTKVQSKATTLAFGSGVALTPGEVKSVTESLALVRGDYTAKDVEVFMSTANRWAATGRKASALRRFHSAIAAGAAHASLIGEGKTFATGEEWGKSVGISKAQVTGLRRLGTAIRNGYGPEFPSYPFASRQAGHAVGGMLETITDANALHVAMTKAEEDSKATPGTPRPSNGSDTATENADTPADVTVVTPFEAAKGAVQTLRAVLPLITDREEFAAVEDMLNNLLAAAVSQRTPVAPKPTAVAVPRKKVSRTVAV